MFFISLVRSYIGKFFLLSALCTIVLPSSACAQESRLTRGRISQQDGFRDFLLYVPASIADITWDRPLIVVLHGGGGNAGQISRATRRRFEELADRFRFFVVYPNAIDGIWDTGGGFVSNGLTARRDDLRFLTQLIQSLTDDYPIDEAQVFVTGVSRGGHASFMLACRSRDVSAIAVVAMTLPDHLVNDCQRTPPVGLLMIAGTEDPIVPFNGGRITAFNRPRDAVRSFDQSVSIFADRNRCSGVANEARVDRFDDGTVLYSEIWRCQAAPLVAHTVIGGGHAWPPYRTILPWRLVGTVSRELLAADAIVEFFLSQP